MLSPRRVAFTLIELLVVISIITFLAAVLTVTAIKVLPESKKKACTAKLNNLAQALTDYYSEFQAYPPAALTVGSSGADAANSTEWWRYLTLTGTGFGRPQRYDGTIREQSFIDEEKLGLVPAGGIRLPSDGFGRPILYVYPVDNDAANITTNVATVGLPSGQGIQALSTAQSYYHCVLISGSADKKLGRTATSVVQGRLTNTGIYEGDAFNTDNLVKPVDAN